MSWRPAYCFTQRPGVYQIVGTPERWIRASRVIRGTARYVAVAAITQSDMSGTAARATWARGAAT